MRGVLLVASALSMAACVHTTAQTPRRDSTLLTSDGLALDVELQMAAPQSVFVAAEYAERDVGIEAPIWIEVVGGDPDDCRSAFRFCGPGTLDGLYPHQLQRGTCVSVAQFDYEGEAGDPPETFRVVVHNDGPSLPVRLRVIHSPSRSPDRIRVRRGPLISR
jgi:hypothetical protein